MKMQNSKRSGRCIDYTPSADVTGGSLVLFPSMVAVAGTDIPAGKLGACEAEGVFELPKGNTTAFAQGQVVYIKPDGAFTTDADNGASTNTVYYLRVGVVWEASASGATHVRVKINA
jgi:predicted RecA/RadA family phage recombinase